MSSDLVRPASFRQVSRKSTWSLSIWSTVVTFFRRSSSVRQFGSMTSYETNAIMC